MIPVGAAAEPASFDQRVRQPGVTYLATTPPQAPLQRGYWTNRSYWTRAIDDLCAAYDDTCAYLGMRINRATTHATADHFVPKSLAPNLAYEWTNLRLASPTLNTKKHAGVIPLDPFTILPGEFHLNLLDGKVEVGASQRPGDVDDTIRLLHLNDEPFPSARLRYVDDHLSGAISREHLARWFPFGDAELTRQGV